MKAKKIIVAMLAALLILSSGFLYVFANSDRATISVESVSALAGETVDVDITVENNPGILGAVLSVSYDAGLTLVNAKSGSAFASLDMTKPGRYASPCNFTWDAVEINPESIKDGTIMTLTFEVPSDAENGKKYNIDLSVQDGDVIDTDLNPVDLTLKSGTITVGSAVEEPETPIVTDGTVFTVNSVQGTAGNTVDVSVNLANNPGIIGAIISVNYDNRLVLKNAVSGNAFSALTMTKPGRYTSPCNFTWDAIEISEDDIKDGTVLTLTFEVPSNAQDGDDYSVSLSSNDGDIIDGDLNAVSAEFVSGNIHIGATTEPEEPITNKTRFVVDSVEATLGSEVNVNITIENNPGVLGATLSISYDDGLILKNAVSGNAFSVLTMTKPGRYQSPCQFAWDGMEISEQDIADGIVLTLTFEVQSDAQSGHKYAINVSSEYGDIVDLNLNAVDADFVSGGITINHTHTYTTQTVQPTCTEKGYVKYTCVNCSYEYITDYTNEIGHYYQYTGNGANRIMTYRCVDCGYTMSLNAVDVLDLWASKYINLKPNKIDNRTRKDNSSLINVVSNSRGDEIINAKDYALILKSSKK